MSGKVKGKLLAALMSLAVVFTMIPLMGQAVHADDAAVYDLFVGGTQVTDTNCGDVLGDGKVSFTPAADGEPAVLELDSAEIEVASMGDTDAAGIYVGDGGEAGERGVYVGDLTITLAGKNRIVMPETKVGSEYINGIIAYGDSDNKRSLEIIRKGNSGSLEIDLSDDESEYVRGMYYDDYKNVYVMADLSMYVDSGKNGYGIYGDGDLTIKCERAEMDVIAPNATGFYIEGNLYLDTSLAIDLNEGQIGIGKNANTGIQGDGTGSVSIRGGAVKIRSSIGKANCGINDATVNLRAGSLIIHMGAAEEDGVSYGLYLPTNEKNSYGINMSDKDFLNNGGYVEITGHTAAVSPDTSIDPNLLEKTVLVNGNPTGTGAATWDGSSAFSDYKYLYLGKTYTLTLHFSSLDGVDRAGQEPVESVKINGVPAGMSVEDALEREGLSFEEIFKEDGYRQMEAGLYVPLTYFRSWRDLFTSSEKAVLLSDTLTGDTDIYIPMLKDEVKSASVTVKPPVSGEKTETKRDNYGQWDLLSQTNPPEYSFPAGADYGELTISDLLGIPGSFWGSFAEGSAEAFTGTFEEGKRYDFGVSMMPEYGYSFTEGASISVNGNKAKNMVSMQGIVLVAFSDIEAVRNVPVDPRGDEDPQSDKPSETDFHKMITSHSADGDLAGSSFGLLKARGAAKGKKNVQLKWADPKLGAAKYIVYGNQCKAKGKSHAYVKLSESNAGTYKCVSTNISGQKLKKGTYYKFVVAAVDKNGRVIAVSKTIHVTTNGGKKGNFKSVKRVKPTKKSKYAIKAGKTKKLKVKAAKGKKKVAKHRAMAWESSNTNIAAVSKKGKVTAKSKGTCTIYAYAQNGVYKAFTITVK